MKRGRHMKLMAFDLGGTSVKYGTYVKDELIDKGSFVTPNSLEELMEKMTSVMNKQEKIEGVAISAPGSVNQKDRVKIGRASCRERVYISVVSVRIIEKIEDSINR